MEISKYLWFTDLISTVISFVPTVCLLLPYPVMLINIIYFPQKTKFFGSPFLFFILLQPE